MDEEGCDCEKCKMKKKYRLEGIELVERKFAEDKGLYTMGVPKAKIKEIINSAKVDVK